MEKENITLVELKDLGETSEQLARDIRMLSRGVKKMLNAGLRRETIVLLLSSSSSVGKVDTRRILDALEGLERDYLTKPKEAEI